jgi:hypothetical protein
MKVINWEDIDCTVRLKKDDNSLEFEVFEIMGKYENEKTGKYDKPIYERKGANSSEDETENLDEAQTLLRGIIKWDACSHVYFGDDEGYIHLCGGRSWFVFQQAVKRIWEIAIKELPQEHSKDMFDLELFNN